VSLLNVPSNPNQTASGSGSTSAIPTPALVQEKKRKHHLSASTDPIFAELRDLNFASIGKRLNKAARRLDEDYGVYKVRMCLSREMRSSIELLLRRINKHLCLNCVTLWENWVVFKPSTELYNFVSLGLVIPPLWC
jgi:vacuolar protein sorting-associated protein 33A